MRGRILFINLFLFTPVVILIALLAYRGFTVEQPPGEIKPHVAAAIPAIDQHTPPRVVDLINIIYALEKYKLAHDQYPVSKGFDGLYSFYGRSGSDWIAGLAPDYIAQLPRDPRLTDSGNEQYLYVSNGAHYKLIAHHADDCELVKKIYPQLIDPIRDCTAYGFWTPDGVKW